MRRKYVPWPTLIIAVSLLPLLIFLIVKHNQTPTVARSTGSQLLYAAAGSSDDNPAARTAAPGTSSYRRPARPTSTPAPYSDLLRWVKDARVQQILLTSTPPRSFVLLKKSNRVYRIEIPVNDSNSLGRQISAAGGKVEVLNQAPSSGGFSWRTFIMILFAAFLLFLILRFFLGRLSASGKMPRARRDASSLRDGAELGEAPTVKFSDVAGCPEVVQEVKEFVEFLKSPERFQAVGAKMPSGLLLYGPPGTGKTLVAKALAGEAEVPFFAVSGSEFVEKYVGVGASRVRELFERARAAEAGAVVFIDEIDAIGRSRSGGGDHNSEREQTLNELLTQMDGFPTGNQVIVVAATNRRDVLDPALTRPGRFARQVRVGTPDKEGRLEILRLYAHSKPLSEDVDLEALAEVTAGCSGAELADMLNEAAIMAAREELSSISQDHLAEGQLRAIAGPERRSSMSAEERTMVAYHESGHVLCAELCEEHEKAQRATIRPRGTAGGLALYGQQDRALHSAQYVHERLICALGGRAAEWVQYGKVSSGAANDLLQANSVARHAVQELGFSPRTGQMITSSEGREVNVSDGTRQLMDREVERMVAEAYAEAVRLLEEHKEALARLAEALLSSEDLDRLELVAAMGVDNDLTQPARTAPSMAPRRVPVLHQPRAPQVRSRLSSAKRRMASAWRRPKKALDAN
jgi:cell division protease FtsH